MWECGAKRRRKAVKILGGGEDRGMGTEKKICSTTSNDSVLELLTMEREGRWMYRVYKCMCM